MDSSDDSDADLSHLIPAIHTHHQKVSQRVNKKQQQQESSLEQSLPPRKYITRRPQISKIIKVQGYLPSGRKIGRSHIQKVISVQDSDNLSQLQRADRMIGGDWEVERQTPDSNNMEVGNGMGKADQCEDNRKLGNSDQNQQKKYNLRSRKVNDIVGNSKSDDVDFKCIETDESNANDVQENEDYVEMVQGDVNCISGQPTNMFYFSGGQPSRFHKSQHQMYQMPDTRMQYNQFLLGQQLIHPQVYSGVSPVYFPHSYSYNWEYPY